MDETEYLLSSEANRKYLLASIEEVKKDNVVEVNFDELEDYEQPTTESDK